MLCKYCGVEKDESSFEVCKVVSGRAYRRLRCKQCKRGQKNDRRQKLRGWLDDYKRELVCIKCGFADFRALVFHHSGDEKKDFNIADMIGAGSSIQTIINEIGKCEVLCSNCHQIEHYRSSIEIDIDQSSSKSP